MQTEVSKRSEKNLLPGVRLPLVINLVNIVACVVTNVRIATVDIGISPRFIEL